MTKFLQWTIKLSLLTVLIAAVVYCNNMLWKLRLDLHRAERSLSQRPEEEGKAVALRIELGKRLPDIKRITALSPLRDQLGVFVSQLGVEAQKNALTFAVPIVEERILNDKNGVPIPATGPLMDVRMNIVASGDPSNLVQFLHFIETAPYITRVQSWRLESSSTKTVQGSVRKAPTDRTQAAAPNAGYLQADVIIGVANPNWVKP